MKNIRYFAEASILWLAFLIFRALPYRKASDLGGWIGRSIGPKLAASRKAYKNIAAALPGKTEDEYKFIVRDMWNNLGRVIAEYPHLREIIQDVKVVGMEHLESMPDSFVILGAHNANWELMPFFFNYRANLPVTAIYRAPNNPYSEKLLDQCRNPEDRGVYTPKSSSGSRQLVKTLHQDGRIVILFDQKYNQGIEATFFGRPAMTSTSFSQLARKYDCPILPVWVERDGHDFTIVIDKPFMIGERTDAEMVEYGHRILEAQILKNPGQWLWLHRRWIT